MVVNQSDRDALASGRVSDRHANAERRSRGEPPGAARGAAQWWRARCARRRVRGGEARAKQARHTARTEARPQCATARGGWVGVVGKADALRVRCFT